MDRIFHPPTERSPLVDFDFPAQYLRLEGESYPEDAAAFFGPLLEGLRRHLELAKGGELVVELKMSYFNSSSAKALMNIFQMLESAAEKGCRVVINWYYLEDDDTMEEFGEDFSEDFEKVEFNLCVIPAA
ncbi:MAG: DUF1987 domain-containing protein [Deltaproteobacteria bacterium]|nr:DUF1987 domain-containing protein [Deltaproteobacteria bacterium]